MDDNYIEEGREIFSDVGLRLRVTSVRSLWLFAVVTVVAQRLLLLSV